MGLLLGSISVMNPIRSGWAIGATEDDLSEFNSSVRFAIARFCFQCSFAIFVALKTRIANICPFDLLPLRVGIEFCHFDF